MRMVRIGVIDVGSNTTRLLVAEAGSDGLLPLDKQKVNEFTLSLQMKRPAETPGTAVGKLPPAAAKATTVAPQAKGPQT